MKADSLVGINVEREVKFVRHSDLERLEANGYASICPVCKAGTLVCDRDSNTGILGEWDHCLLCGQQFRYIDIEEMRRRE